MHELRIQDSQYLLDCGLYQGRRKEAELRNKDFPFPCQDIRAVLLSHAHIDHSGNLPQLVKKGFHGNIYTSPATADLCHPMLLDSAYLQEKDANYINKRDLRRSSLGIPLHPSHNGPVHPMYTVDDAEHTFPLFHPVPLHTPVEIGPGLHYRSFEAGHLLGSTTMLLECSSGDRAIRLGFTGDLGRAGLPILRDPEPLPPVDFLIMESTYGNRLHQPIRLASKKLADVVNATYRRGGKLIVPSFAVGRAQQLVLMLHELIDQGDIPAFPIFVDSPLAVEVTEVFRKHTELFDEEASRFSNDGEDPFGFKRLTYVRDVSQSKALNDLHGPFMVISASGMCEAGRILHHLKNNIEDPRNTVLITGYQAENTLGRKIEERQREVPIFGEPVRLRAQVEKLDELSGHADRDELLEWMAPLAGFLKRVYLVHGEAEAPQVLAKAIRERYRIEVLVPKRGESFRL